MNDHIISNDPANCMGTNAQPRPTWAAPELDRPDQSERTHPDDRGVHFASHPVDSWTVAEPHDGYTITGSDPVEVTVEGFRHATRPDLDWPDTVRVEGDLNPGGDGHSLTPTTARRLAAALIAAVDKLEGGERNSSTSTWLVTQGAGPSYSVLCSCPDEATARELAARFSSPERGVRAAAESVPLMVASPTSGQEQR
ncbi:hypothetical protein M3697_05400 [Janibacter melonis]|uniref:hypothetical protein n=1 Tax=Janibacter melonis TaxID=262209 RepID=UPI00204462AA|nr:hypothetical protein [Janibacter melonis]MCM3554541.1 hypothetical protein [Janibacter melonis]